MKKFLLLVVFLLAAFAGTVSNAKPAMVDDSSSAPSCDLNKRQQEKRANLDQLVAQGYKLTNYGKLVEAGLVKPQTGTHVYLLATLPKTEKYAAPISGRDANVGGDGNNTGNAVIWYGLTLNNVSYPYSIKVEMDCYNGGEAWTGAPPWESQAGIGVYRDGLLSNPAFAQCLSMSLINCVFQWIIVPRHDYVNYLWIAGAHTFPMYMVGWTHCYT